MSDDVNYVDNWDDPTTQCQNCVFYQVQDDKKACVPPEMKFEQALEEYGEVSPTAHCDNFQAK